MSKKPVTAAGKPIFNVKPIPKSLSVPTPSAEVAPAKAPLKKKSTPKQNPAPKPKAAPKPAAKSVAKENTKPDDQSKGPGKTSLTLDLKLETFEKLIAGVEHYDVTPIEFASKRLLKLYRAFEKEPLQISRAKKAEGETEKVVISIRYSHAVLASIREKIDPLEVEPSASLIGTAFIQYLERTL